MRGKAGFHEEDNCASSILDKKRLNNGKLGRAQPHPPKQTQLRCPECGSSKIWKAGVRRTNHGPVQRLLCRRCGYRFSESLNRDLNPGLQKPLQKSSDWSLNRSGNIHSNRQVCVALTRGAKNLATVESRKEKAAGATKPDAETVKGLITQYAYWLEKEGYYEKSRYLGLIRQLVKLGVNLFDPESVKATIARQRWKNGTRILAVYAYDIMATKILHVEWTRPKYTQEETLPFIPEEAELDQLIAACRSRRMAAYLQTLKETFADPGEALRLRWIDFSAKDNTITINKPVKRHSPRQLQISNKLATMLNALPRNSERIFPTTYRAVCKGFQRIKRRVASNIENPRLLSITLRTFRHWGATMTYHYTKNILLVQKLLGHKNIRNTLKYTQLIHFKDDEFDVATATTLEEAKELLAAGFNYITEMKGVKLFRRPKRFNG